MLTFSLLSACVTGDVPIDSADPAADTADTAGETTGSTDSGTTDSATTDSAGDSGDSGADSGDSGGDSTTGCPSVSASTRSLVVTDIDETLTTDDMEFLYQIVDPSHDPDMRPDANALMRAYHDLGYRVIYLTARGDGLFLLDGTSATDATLAWLDDHGFPRFSDDDVYLASGFGAFSSDAETYKADVLNALQADGFDIVYAYGNADTDVAAYQDAGIDDAHHLLVGDLSVDAGGYGVVGVSNDDAYTNHMASWMSGVPCGY